MAYPRRFIAGVAIALVGLVTPALAEITIIRAEITGGRLVISGRTEVGNQEVRLDQTSHLTISSPNGPFLFEVSYLPPDCVVSIVTDDDRIDDVLIGNCSLPGAQGAAGPRGARTAGPQGPAGPGGTKVMPAVPGPGWWDLQAKLARPDL